MRLYSSVDELTTDLRETLIGNFNLQGYRVFLPQTTCSIALGIDIYDKGRDILFRKSGAEVDRRCCFANSTLLISNRKNLCYHLMVSM